VSRRDQSDRERERERERERSDLREDRQRKNGDDDGARRCRKSRKVADKIRDCPVTFTSFRHPCRRIYSA